MLSPDKIQFIYEFSQEFAFKEHPDAPPEQFLFIVDEYLKKGILTQLEVQGQEWYGNNTVH